MAPANKKTCFVIALPGINRTEKHVETIKGMIRRAVERFGHEPMFEDEIATPGMMAPEVIRRIVTCDVVIADLSGGNANVYYKVAIAHAIGKPTVHLLDQSMEAHGSPDLDVRTVRLDNENQYEIQGGIEEALKEISTPDYEFTTPFDLATLKKAFEDRVNGQVNVAARMFEDVYKAVTTQVDSMRELVKQLEDSIRKPLRGIDDVLVRIYWMLQQAKVGGRICFVGMTLGLGPPHRFRTTPGEATRDPESEAVVASITMDTLVRIRCPELDSFDSLIKSVNERLCALVQAANEPVLVCLDHDDPTGMVGRFLGKLAKRPSYRSLTPALDSVAEEVVNLHRAVEKNVGSHRVRYVDSIPLQILIVEKEGDSPLSYGKKGCVVFHVGTGNIETHVLEGGELGFYTEVDSLVDMFETTAESLWEAGHSRRVDTRDAGTT